MSSPAMSCSDAKRKAPGDHPRRRNAGRQWPGRLHSQDRRGCAGFDACNGWTFWNVETPDGLKLIDEYRAAIRAEMARAG